MQQAVCSHKGWKKFSIFKSLFLNIQGHIFGGELRGGIILQQFFCTLIPYPSEF